MSQHIKAFKEKKILVIVPAYNEEKNIAAVIRKIKKFPGIDVVVVNDGSYDSTSAIAKAERACVIDLPFNLGIGGAVQTGYLYALRNGYDFAVQIDADGQHNPKEIYKLIEPLIDGQADMVVGSRFVQFTGYKAPMARKIGIMVFSAVVSLINRQKFRDTTSGYRAVNRGVIAYFVENYPTDYPEVETLVILRRKGFTIKEIPVNMTRRVHGQSSITPLKSLYYMVKVLFALLMNVMRAKREA